MEKISNDAVSSELRKNLFYHYIATVVEMMSYGTENSRHISNIVSDLFLILVSAIFHWRLTDLSRSSIPLWSETTSDNMKLVNQPRLFTFDPLDKMNTYRINRKLKKRTALSFLFVWAQNTDWTASECVWKWSGGREKCKKVLWEKSLHVVVDRATAADSKRFPPHPDHPDESESFVVF